MKPLHDTTLFTRIGLGVLAHLTREYGHAEPPVAADGAPAATGRVILVTSARPGEGKSFVAHGLAMALAEQQDGDVVRVDAAFGTAGDADDASEYEELLPVSPP